MNHSINHSDQPLPEVVLDIPKEEVKKFLEFIIPNKRIRALAFRACPETIHFLAQEDGTEERPSNGYVIHLRIVYARLKEVLLKKDLSSRFEKYFQKPDRFVDDTGSEIKISVPFSESIGWSPVL